MCGERALVLGRQGCSEVEELFEAIARDIEEPTELRPAWIAPSTVSLSIISPVPPAIATTPRVRW